MKKIYISPSVKLKALASDAALLVYSVTGVEGFEDNEHAPTFGGTDDGTHPVGAKENTSSVWE